MRYTALSEENDGFYENDYVYSKKDIEESKNHPILLIDDLFRITKSDPKDVSLNDPTIRFRLVKSFSSQHTAKEDIEQMIKEYDEAKLNLNNEGPDVNYLERVNKLNLPQGNIFYYFFFNNNMNGSQMAIGIIHKECYNLKIEIAASNFKLLQHTLNFFEFYWLEY